MKKMLLVLQTYPGDFEQARALMRLIADLEPGYNHTADFMLCVRKGMQLPRAELDYISTKFLTRTFETRNAVSGWPNGCNMMWMEAACHVAYRSKRAEWDYEVMLTFEPDCVPLRKGWIEELYAEWKRSRPATFVGNYVCPAPDGTVNKIPDTFHAHYNGNMMVATDFIDKLPEMRTPAMHGGWDMYFASRIIPLGKPSRLIYSDYRRGLPDQQEMSEEEIFAARERAPGNPLHGEVLQPCLLHGCKKLSAIDHVRRRLLEAPAPAPKKLTVRKKKLTEASGV
jgi:hypothetical protein